MKEGLTACMNCGICTGVCPAAEFYDYDPRQIVNTVQTKDDDAIEQLLKSETIWYCGECMSCRPRCPRANTPGYIIQALRRLSQKLGFFTYSEKGRQQLAIKRSVGENILREGYCVTPHLMDEARHPETGPVWKWERDNMVDIFARLGANLDGDGPGPMRRIPRESLEELDRIFEVTGGKARFEKIEEASAAKAREMGLTDQEYLDLVYATNSGCHSR